MEDSTMGEAEHDPGAKGKKAWNAGRKPSFKRALKPKEIWAIRFWLDHKGRRRDRAMFDLAIDRKLRGCDILKVKIGDVVLGAGCAPAPPWSSRKRAGPCISNCSTPPRPS